MGDSRKGSAIQFKQAQEKTPCPVPQYGELLMLAAGTGLAPMVPILQSITDNADDETFVTLVGCFKTFEGIYLKTFLQEQARFWNVRTFFVLSQVSPGWCLPSLIETLLSPAPVLVPAVASLPQALIIIPATGGTATVCLARRAGIVTFTMQMRKLPLREAKVPACALLPDG